MLLGLVHFRIQVYNRISLPQVLALSMIEASVVLSQGLTPTEINFSLSRWCTPSPTNLLAKNQSNQNEGFSSTAKHHQNH